jgi:sulfatase modifying factor 1
VTLDPIAWFCGNSGGTSRAVGGRGANAWGLLDMYGSVWEWCYDSAVDGTDYPAGAATDPWGLASGLCRVIRGGCWNCNAIYSRAAYRECRAADYLATTGYGYRPVRSLP